MKSDSPSSLVYIALSMMTGKQNSLLPELLYFMSSAQILTFIKMYSGEVIKIPTAKEFHKEMLAALAVYHIHVEKKSWDWMMLEYDLDGYTTRYLKRRVRNWINELPPEELDFLDSMKGAKDVN